MTDKQKILSKIGEEVKFGYPGKEGKRYGELIHRIIVHENKVGNISYWDIVDFIKFKDENTIRMRIGYYRKKRVLRFAGQNTITEPLHIWKKIFVNAAKDKDREWFRNLLKDVIKERPKWDKKSSNK